MLTTLRLLNALQEMFIDREMMANIIIIYGVSTTRLRFLQEHRQPQIHLCSDGRPKRIGVSHADPQPRHPARIQPYAAQPHDDHRQRLQGRVLYHLSAGPAAFRAALRQRSRDHRESGLDGLGPMRCGRHQPGLPPGHRPQGELRFLPARKA